MIGVNSLGHEPAALEAVMTEENLPWLSYADDGSIARQWGNPATPMFYVLDHEGRVRHKWAGIPGAAAMDAALEVLVGEAEGRPGREPRENE